MGKLSIPKTLQQISTIGLLTTAPLIASGQFADSTVTMTRVQRDSFDLKKDTHRQKIADSIYQILIPTLVNYYTPQAHHTKKIAKICSRTQSSLESAILKRENYTTINGQYIAKKKQPDEICLDSSLEDTDQIKETLTHEGFHVERRDQIKENVRAYKMLPLAEMQEAYQGKELLESLKIYKKLCLSYNEDMYYEKTILSECEEESKVTRVFLLIGDSMKIAKIDTWIDQIEKGNMNFNTEDIGEIGKCFSGARWYTLYLTSPHEMYARSRVLEMYAKDLWNIKKGAITVNHIKQLRMDPMYKDQNFLLLLDGFEKEFLIYLNSIEPK